MVPGPPGGRNDQRPHRPHELGPRVFRRGRWFAADLRPWDGGRPTLRNPSARGWPDRGSRTEDSETARRWAWAYVDHYRDEQKRKHLGLSQKSRPLGPAALEWIRHRERQKKSAKTIEGGTTAIGHLEDYLGPDHAIEEITSAVLQEFFNSFLDAGYAVTTLDTMRRHFSSFFGWARIEPNPASRPRLDMPDMPEWEARDWSNEDLVRIRAAANKIDEARDGKPPYMRRSVEVALGTGGRQAELYAFDRRDFSDVRKAVRVVRQLDRSGGRREKLKGKRARTAVVLPFTWDWLPESGLVLPDEDGGTIKTRRSRDLLLEVLEEAGLYEDGIGHHRFRHTYARLFLEMGGWMDELQRSLGHASIKTTERIYGHFAPERAAHFAVSRIYGEGRRLRAI